ncbi:uncharacterized protein LOC126907830 isoform X2 [Daktulosphaira vitifoliae]|uniref:uncharacterized protein LOC126907830 isoform X2 n=1 Tax=Daktulosphaira vitifoliae TaxID=58002 RepID=UPI0021AABFE1|nr:uncharacterized protein LOC126907830 isoform X2 [Daktulosphaira vitifoliae]
MKRRLVYQYPDINIYKNNYHSTIYIKTLVEGSLSQFIKSIQVFLTSSNHHNIYVLYVCLSQIKKCLLIYESTLKGINTVFFKKSVYIYTIKRIQKCFFKIEDYFERIDISDNDNDETPGIFTKRINTVLNYLSKKQDINVIKPIINKILFQAITIAKVSEEMHNLDIISSSKQVIKEIEELSRDSNLGENDYSFKFDYLSSLISILERRINSSILHLVYKVFCDPFFTIKQLIKKCGEDSNIQYKKCDDLSIMVQELDNYTDILIQIGIYAISSYTDIEDIIALKCCISSLELLDSDMVPAIVGFYLDPTSSEKKSFVKLLINHWITEIIHLQKLFYKIIDPITYTQTRVKMLLTINSFLSKTVLETSLVVINNIRHNNSNNYIVLFTSFLNDIQSFSKYLNETFKSKSMKENEFFTTLIQLDSALKECNACLICTKNDICKKNTNTIDKMLKRCDYIIKKLKYVQSSLIKWIMNNSATASNITYILSKTAQPINNVQYNVCDSNNDALEYLLSTNEFHSSFYKLSEIKSIKTNCKQINYLNYMNDDTNMGNTVMDLTSILDNLIETFNPDDNDHIIENIWST